MLKFIGEVKVELDKCSWPWDPNLTGFKKYKELSGFHRRRHPLRDLCWRDLSPPAIGFSPTWSGSSPAPRS